MGIFDRFWPKFSSLGWGNWKENVAPPGLTLIGALRLTVAHGSRQSYVCQLKIIIHLVGSLNFSISIYNWSNGIRMQYWLTQRVFTFLPSNKAITFWTNSFSIDRGMPGVWPGEMLAAGIYSHIMLYNLDLLQFEEFYCWTLFYKVDFISTA